ncbi:unnamed protein product [Bursaphelenchus xylophilus]|uniref:(pine wood nematode) hypothetical protein n=1 Tax=Bursaphelenchus xylophilus TaxID=6326 RepID=A0A7I8XF55_BURXY|nr:unnamed protein product [Bursaphelenchus xylophilus]CAG9113326.1 unnamed protein product [Bursaphelenchus xylophilus]
MYALPSTENQGNRYDYLVPHKTDFGHLVWKLDRSSLDVEGNEVICSPQFGPNGVKDAGFTVKVYPNGFDENSEEFVSILVSSTENCGKVIDRDGDIYLYKDAGFNEFLGWKLEFSNSKGPIALASRRPLVNVKDYENQAQVGLVYGRKKFFRRSELLKLLENDPLTIVCYARRFVRRTVYFDENLKPEHSEKDKVFEEAQRTEEELDSLRRKKEEQKQKMFMEEEEEDEKDPDVEEVEVGKEEEDEEDDDEGLGEESQKTEDDEKESEEDKESEDSSEDGETKKDDEEKKEEDEMNPEAKKDDENESKNEQQRDDFQGEPKKTFEEKEWNSYKKKGNHDVLLIFKTGPEEFDQAVICKHSEYFRRECEKAEEMFDGMVVIDMRTYKYSMFVPIKMFMYEYKWPLEENIDPMFLHLVNFLEIEELMLYIDHFLTFNLRPGYSPVMLKVAKEYKLKTLQKASGQYITVFYSIFEAMKTFKDFVKQFYDVIGEALSGLFKNFKFW